MVKMTCIGSGSSGNCYLLAASDGVLIVEAGISLIEVKKALRFDISGVVGCVVTHSHGDHAKYVKDFIASGIRVLALPDVFQSHGIEGLAFRTDIEPRHGYKVVGFKVYAFSVAHDVPCLGFVIEHQEMGKLLFVTDTMMLPYRFGGLNHFMIECNYSDEILFYNIENGIIPAAMRERLLHSHMEIETTKGILKANDLDGVSEVVLIHLSGNNSDADAFCRDIESCCGKPVYAARRGFSIEFGKTAY